jgi:hypothetical protein
LAAAKFIPADAAEQIMIRNRSVLDALPRIASPIPSADRMIMPASSIVASIIAGTFAFLTAKMYRYWASKETYKRPASSIASSQVAAAMSMLPGSRSLPASLRILVMSLRVSPPSLLSIAKSPGPLGILMLVMVGSPPGSCWREEPWLTAVPWYAGLRTGVLIGFSVTSRPLGGARD